MVKVESELIKDIVVKDFFSRLNSLKIGDTIVIYYTVVGDTTKLKDLVGVFKGLSGKGINKSLKVLIFKGGSCIELLLYVNYILFYEIRIIRKN